MYEKVEDERRKAKKKELDERYASKDQRRADRKARQEERQKRRDERAGMSRVRSPVPTCFIYFVAHDSSV